VVCIVCHCPSMSVPGQWLKRLAIILHRAWVVVARFETLTGTWQGWFVLKHSCVGHLIMITSICALCVQDGRTPLFIACEENFPECIKLLLQAGADADKADEVNHNLHTDATSIFHLGVCIVWHFPSLSVPGQLLKRLRNILSSCMSCDSSLKNSDRNRKGVYNLLQRSCVDHLIIITIICVLCVQCGETLLTTACYGGCIECVKLLLQAGEDANKADRRVNHKHTQPPLHFFCRWFALSVTVHQCQCLANDLNVWQSSFIVHELW